MLNYLWIVLAAYQIGSLSPSYFFSKLRGFDLRDRGSGNAGGSNAVVTMGKATGVACILLDILKGYLGTTICMYLFKATYSYEVAAVALIIGHVFPYYMKFRGGKGFASFIGVVIAYSPVLFLVLAAIEIPFALIVDYICAIPITASIAFPIIYYVQTRSVIGTIILCILPVVIVCRHIENLKRIRAGKELHISYIWKKNKEVGRMIEEDETGANLYYIILDVMKDMDKNRPVEKIAKRNGIDVDMVEKILQIYTTHPGIDAHGIMDRM